jgi:hypothetical protein
MFSLMPIACYIGAKSELLQEAHGDFLVNEVVLSNQNARLGTSFRLSQTMAVDQGLRRPR